MHRPNIEKIEIVEPPLQELSKRPSVWKRSCLFGCAGILILGVGFVVAIKLALGPGPKTLRAAPKNFPTAIPLYDRENIERITYIPGRYKNRAVELAAVVPKILLAPMFITMSQTGETPTNTIANEPGTAAKIWRLLRTPVSDAHDTVQIEWHAMDAEPSFIYRYYRTELRKQKFSIDSELTGVDFQQMTFSNSAGVTGFLSVHGNEEERPGTDYAILTVNLTGAASRTSTAQ